MQQSPKSPLRPKSDYHYHLCQLLQQPRPSHLSDLQAIQRPIDLPDYSSDQCQQSSSQYPAARKAKRKSLDASVFNTKLHLSSLSKSSFPQRTLKRSSTFSNPHTDPIRNLKAHSDISCTTFSLSYPKRAGSLSSSNVRHFLDHFTQIYTENSIDNSTQLPQPQQYNLKPRNVSHTESSITDSSSSYDSKLLREHAQPQLSSENLLLSVANITHSRLSVFETCHTVHYHLRSVSSSLNETEKFVFCSM